ncbi:hypothetical protein ABL78_2826 [Leptomonas seymouri]|uniref:Uncharacterized protein n=1 Tax=Leptomonas seymouri TaxID=5684 RepID=A0A0N0P6W2_LEPSE|nr:hypothetical protein ABL78_2826 [Leptomonas seymouri]|eukprot:KPI88096.1 hypothetical protein ABL78_2826 [Leptomonas seymouri]
MMNLGDNIRSINGMWGVDCGYQVRSRQDPDLPAVAKVLQDDEVVDGRRLVTATKKMLEREAKAESGKPSKTVEEDVRESSKKEAAATDVKAAKSDAEKKEAARSEAKDDERKDNALSLGDKKNGTELSGAAEKATGDTEDYNAIQSIVVVDGAGGDRVKVEKAEPGQKVIIQNPAGKPVECKATDLLRGPEASLEKSTVLNMMALHVKSGHNVCLIAINTKATVTPLFTKAITAFFTGPLEGLGTESKWKAAFSATAISGPNKYRDLLKPDNAAPSDIAFGSNPIFGPCIMEAKLAELKEVGAVEKQVKETLEKKVDPQEILFLQAVVHIRRDKDLFLCSLNAFVLRAIDAAEGAAVLDDRRVPVPLMRTAIGGPTRTAVLVSVGGAEADAASESDVFRVVASILTKENLSARSGNVPRFIEYTNEQVAKIEKEMQNLSGEAKERNTHMVERMRTMANDAKELIANPDAAGKVYPIYLKGASGSAPAKDASAAAGARDVATSPHKSGAAAAASTNGSAHGPAGASAAAGSAADGAAAPDAAAATTAPPAAPPATPFSSIHRLVYMQDAKTASVSKVVEVVVDGVKKAYDVDECINSPHGAKPQSLQESMEVKRLSGILLSGHNIAVLGAECLSPTVPAEQMTWKYVKHLLAAVLTPPTPEMTNEVSLRMSVLHELDVVADLISGSTKQRRLDVAVSPLFGPLVHDSAAAKVRTPQEMLTTVDKALAQAASCLTKQGSLIVMTAVVKQILKGDVRVASVFAVSAADMSPSKGFMEHSPKILRSLFSCALGGPASTALLISASHKTKPSELAALLSTQRNVSFIKVQAPRSGSVKQFVQYSRDSLERLKKRASASAGVSEKERVANSMRRLEDSLKHSEELLAHPLTVEPRAYLQEVSDQSEAVSPMSNRVAEARASGHAVSPGSVLPSAAAATTSVQASSEIHGATPNQLQGDAKVQPQGEMKEKSAVEEQQKKSAGTPQEDVKENKPAAPGTTEEKSAMASNDKSNMRPVQFLAVVTQENRPGLQVKAGWSVVGSGNNLVVTDVEGPHNFEADEVVLRQNRNAPIVSTMLEELRTKFLEGQNVALITADTRGSTSSLEAVDRSVRGILSKLSPTSSLHMSFSALKDQANTVLDTINEEDSYKPMEVSTSPLFGPVVAGASFRKISTVEEFVRLMSTGLRKCGEGRACVVLQLLQVKMKPEEADVCVNSFLAIMCPGDIGVYRRALELPVKERGIFSLALGGSCHTVYVAGLTKSPADEGCLQLPRLAQALKASVHNLKPRDSSMKRFIMHTKGAVAQVQRNIQRATSAEEKAKMQVYLETVQNMVETSEAYLADPVDKVPPTYPLNNHPERREL